MSETILNGRYALTGQQGSGGMSVIYKAQDLSLGRNVAIKILRPSLTQDVSFLERFHNEARSIANLSHPNIVTVHDFGSDEGAYYIVMELVDGMDLKKIIKAEGALAVERALNLAIQICAGIGYAHRSGLVHADVKPQNVLLTSNEVVKVTDFGIAQALSDTQPQQRAEVVWGSPHYFAPEQARGEQPSPASDVYAIGIVMFEMLTGRLPYSGYNQQELAMAHIKQPVPMVTDINPQVPAELARIVAKVMSKTPNDRYRTADQLKHVLESYRDNAQMRTAAGGITPAPPQSRPQTPPPPMQQPERPPNVPRPPQAGPPRQPSAPQPNPQQPPTPYNEPTARYSAAPMAPNYQPPRPPGQNNASNVPQPPPQNPSVSPPQPLQQRYATPPPPQPSNTMDRMDRMDSQAYYSRPMAQSEPRRDDDGSGTDWVTIVLAFLAFIAVLGLFPLWFVVLSAR